MPGCSNGIEIGLKNRRLFRIAGSSPVSGTIYNNLNIKVQRLSKVITPLGLSWSRGVIISRVGWKSTRNGSHPNAINIVMGEDIV